MKNRLELSVIVPTYKRPNMIARCLVSLQNQVLDPGLFEVIVIDDDADDEIRKIVESFMNDRGPLLRYIAVPKRSGPATARNLGIKAASGKVIAFTDDDCLPTARWLEAGLREIRQRQDFISASGKLVMPLPEVATDYEADAARLATADFVTANAFCKRDVLLAVGGFDERFNLPWREDSDLFFRLKDYVLEQSLTSRHCRFESAVVIHPIRPAQWGVSIQQQKKSAFNALLFKKHPVYYRRHIQSYPPFRYYAAVSSGVLFFYFVLAGNLTAAYFSAVIWALVTIDISRRRLQGRSKRFSHVTEMLFTSIVIPPLSIYWRLIGAWRYRVLFL